MAHASLPRPVRSRFAQSNFEALITLGLFAVYFVWWYAAAYGLGSGPPEEYTYICGFPAWFFFSCIAGYPLLTLALWFVVRRFFRDVPLDAETSAETNEETGGENGHAAPRPFDAACRTDAAAADRMSGPGI